MNYFFNNQKKGFTLIELLVVISIIGVLSTIVFSSFSQSREKARIAKRVADLKQVQNALEFYYAVNKSYPNPGGGFRSECNTWGGLARNNVIPGLVPTYLPIMPSDPSMVITEYPNCYIYISNGTDYAFIAHDITDLGSVPYTYQTYPELIDPARDGGPNTSIVDGSSIWAWKVYSRGGATF